ncbi:MAG: hypothetical protein U5N58_07655 [Actinomycetota bacterium]|nr:hypothetical protein [Actinomycetota bacterium]
MNRIKLTRPLMWSKREKERSKLKLDNENYVYENPRKIIADALVELGQEDSRVSICIL